MKQKLIFVFLFPFQAARQDVQGNPSSTTPGSAIAIFRHG